MVQPPPQKGPDAHDVIRLVALSTLGVAVVTICVMALFPKPQAAPIAPAAPDTQAGSEDSFPKQSDADVRREALVDAGLDPNTEYPWWPLVFTFPEITRKGRTSDYLVGEVRNHGPKRYRYVQISFSLLHNGVKVADAFDNTAGLAPYETWRYEAYVSYDGLIDSIRVDNVSAY
jgi:hypothetical protein